MRSLILALSLSGCAAGQGARDDGPALARELATREAGEPSACISTTTTTGQTLTVVDWQTITYESGGAIWVNRLDRDCPGLRPHATLIVETRGPRYCRGDRVRGLARGSSIPGPICVLNTFTPYRRR